VRAPAKEAKFRHFSLREEKTMMRDHLKARLLRALSGKTQEEIGEEIDIHPTRVGQIEQGKFLPKPEYLEQLAAAAGITAAGAEEILRVYEVLRRPRRRDGRSAEGVLEQLIEDQRALIQASYRRLLTLPLPYRSPRAEDRQQGDELFARLQEISEEGKLAVVEVAEQYQSWALCERVCHASEREAWRDVERAAALARLGQEIAERVRGSEEWRQRVQGYSEGHNSNVLRVRGELEAADASFDEAKRLWLSGSDPSRLLDPGRMLDLEASLRRDQGRFSEALALLDEAVAVGRSPGRALINKGFTLAAMGEYERAVEALFQADLLIDRKADPWLGNTLDLNLVANYCHVGRYGEAAELVPRIREFADQQGDELDRLPLSRLEDRIAAGQRRREEAV
jgi:tetratricopeptide (TPR) repeat protein/DNA-binding XRE family transcriptional regulator